MQTNKQTECIQANLLPYRKTKCKHTNERTRTDPTDTQFQKQEAVWKTI